ncbi:hypothetical protein VTO42DRAFT_6175 [Malbranchea cinnamomea]
MEPSRGRFQCQFPGCNRSYLRSEHLNRHALSHRKGAFVCYLCQRRFTRNDLLNAHLRRHEKRGHSAGAPAAQQPAVSSTAAPEPSASATPTTSQAASPTDPRPPGTRVENHVEPARDAFGAARPAVIDEIPPTASMTLPPPPPALLPPAHLNDLSHPYPPASPSDALSHHSASSGTIPHTLTQQPSFFPASVGEDDSSWLFQGASLFDLPPDDYLNLHFGGALGPPSPTLNLQSLPPPLEIPRFTPMDHERLLNECPALLSTPLKDFSQTSYVFFQALDYCDIHLSLFHRPTLDLSSCPPVLCLAICCLGAFLSSVPGIHDAGKVLYKHIWSSTVEKALLRSPRVEMCFLQTLILVEHICTYTMGRHEHEMSEILHSIIVTLASRNNLMTENYRTESGSRQSLETKWKEWAQRETVIRIAHTIFVNDVQYMVYFSHRAALSVGMMKLPLPSHPSLWEAKTAADWEVQMRQSKKSSRSRYTSLDAAVESIMSVRESEQKREFIQRHVAQNPVSLHLVIHGIASAIADNNYRSVTSASSSAASMLKKADFDEALKEWRACFDMLPEAERGSKLSWCALVMYLFSTVLLRNSLADIQMAAGSAFSSGRAVTPQGAQAAYTRLTTTDPVNHDSYLRGLEVVILCLQENNGTVVGAGGLSKPPLLAPRPLWQSYCAFLGVLVLWAHAIGFERRERAETDSTMFLRSFNPSLIAGPAAPTLASMYERELARSGPSSSGDKQLIKNDLRRLIGTVRDLLLARPWEISHEAARILTSLLERESTTTRGLRSGLGQIPGLPPFSGSGHLPFYQ